MQEAGKMKKVYLFILLALLFTVSVQARVFGACGSGGGEGNQQLFLT
jgi:hypothetical protein